MANTTTNARKRLLDPIERSSEVLFGLIMVLTFTGALRATGLDHDDVRRMLVAALGCNLAWGIIDAVFYLLATLSERGHNLALLRDVQAADAERGREILNDAMSDDLAAVLTEAEVEAVRVRMTKISRPEVRLRLYRSDFLAAVGVFLLVFLSTFPVVLPFVFMRNPVRSLRISNLIAVIMLFLTGWTYGKYGGYRPWHVGAFMVVVGLCMVALTIALGG